MKCVRPMVMLCLLMVGCQDARVVPDAISNRPGDAARLDEQRTDGGSAMKTAASVEDGQPLKDEEISASIRQQMMNSEMARNLQEVKIVTQDGKVILRGVVKTVEEKQQVEVIAENIAGTGNVANWLEVE